MTRNGDTLYRQCPIWPYDCNSCKLPDCVRPEGTLSRCQQIIDCWRLWLVEQGHLPPEMAPGVVAGTGVRAAGVLNATLERLGNGHSPAAKPGIR